MVQQYLTENLKDFSNHKWHSMYAKTGGVFEMDIPEAMPDNAIVFFPHSEYSDSATGFKLSQIKTYFRNRGLVNGKVYQVT